MRIISGKHKGRKLNVPKTKLKPTKDITREALFNIIEVLDKTVLDLFSGSGSFGLECLSRGCKDVVFVEKNRRAVSTIKKNLSLIDEKASIFPMDVLSFLKKNSDLKSYEVIFLDPPYNEIVGIDTLIFLDKNAQLNDNVIIIYEHSNERTKEIKEEISFQNIRIVKNKRYGNSSLTFFEKR